MRNLYNIIKKILLRNLIFRQYYSNGNIKYIEHWDDNKIIVAFKYYPNNILKEEIHYDTGFIHRDDKPAKVLYYQDGSIEQVTYYCYGKMHRDGDLPAIIHYKDGKIELVHYYQYGHWHRDNGPAYILYYTDGTVYYEMYYRNGVEYKHDETVLEYELSHDSETMDNMIGHIK